MQLNIWNTNAPPELIQPHRLAQEHAEGSTAARANLTSQGAPPKLLGRLDQLPMENQTATEEPTPRTIDAYA